MPRVPKGNGKLCAGERVKLYEQAQAERKKRFSLDNTEGVNTDESLEKVEAGATEFSASRDNSVVCDEIDTKIAKKTLPKPQSATVKVDLSVKLGDVAGMHGFCNGPLSYGADITHLFKEIGVPTVRFDATDGANSAYAVDISRIFKDMNADPNDSKNYDFSVTDKYVTEAYKSGANIIYRLGESRDKLGFGKQVALPQNIDRWINVAINVIRRYNDYFAGGYALGIERFEIWSHDYSLDKSEWTKEFEFYSRVASTIKLMDNNLKVGGMLFRGCDDAAREFIRYCRKNHAPLDFITLSLWDSDPRRISKSVSDVSAYAKNQGFGTMDTIVAEWGYAGADINFYDVLNSGTPSDDMRAMFESQSSIKGAAFAAATMLELNSAAVADTACFFDAQPMISPFTAICDRFGKPQKPFYTFKAYGELYRAGEKTLCEVEKTDGYSHSGIYACSAVSRSGEAYIMIASCGGCGTVDLRVDGIADNLYTADIYILDGVKNLELGDSTPLSGAKKRMVFNVCEYGAILVKLY